jgi:filamentous hemagglutinin family protein
MRNSSTALDTIRRSAFRAALLAGVSLLPFAASAQPAPNTLPTGGSVASGAASIATTANQMNVTQSTQQAIINWQTFSIGSNAQVNFIQPNASSVALNRVMTPVPSEIYGKLTANGSVFILNASGIIIGNGAQINVGSLVASTMGITDQDFLAGNYRFTRNGTTAGIVNHGNVQVADGGYLAMLAPTLRNEGVLSARLGSVVLAAGEAVTLGLAGNVSVRVDPATVATLIDNRAMIVAEGGRAILTAKAADTLIGGAINMSGAVVADAIDTSGGEIVLDGSGPVTVTGRLSARGTTGGSIAVDGDAIALAGATLDVDGVAGGGTMRVGSWSSSSASVDAASTLTASASGNGDGGRIEIFSAATNFAGAAFARGGSSGGNGGFIETSGTQIVLAPTIRIDAGASLGTAGLWLIDPQDLTIDAGGAATIAAALATTNVTATTSACNVAYGSCSGTNGDIFVNSAITPVVTAASGTTLTLQADRHITINSNIDATGGANKLNIVLNSNRSGTGGGIVVAGAALRSNGGDVTMVGGTSNGYAQGLAAFNAGRGIWLSSAAVVQAGGGNILMRGQGGAGQSYAIGMDIAGGSTVATTGAGTITLDGVGASSTGGGFSSGVNLHGDSAVSTVNGNISITGQVAASSTDPAYGISFDADSTGHNRVYSTTGNITLTANGTNASIVGATASASSSGYIGWNGTTATSGTVTLSAANINLNATNAFEVRGGAITLTGDQLTLSGTTTVTTAGALTIAPRNSGTTIGLGTGTGTLAVTNAILARIASGYSSFTLGNSSAGAFNIGGAVTAFSAAATLRTGGTMTLANGSSVSSSASGDALNLVANQFVNNGATLTAASGRWLVYSNDISNDTRGGLTGSFNRYGCSFAGSCPTGVSVPTTGNGFVYSTRPSLYVDVTASATTPTGVAPVISGATFAYSGLVGGDTDAGVSGVKVASMGPQFVVGPVAITADFANAVSTLGYNFVNRNSGTLTVTAVGSPTVNKAVEIALGPIAGMSVGGGGPSVGLELTQTLIGGLQSGTQAIVGGFGLQSGANSFIQNASTQNLLPPGDAEMLASRIALIQYLPLYAPSASPPSFAPAPSLVRTNQPLTSSTDAARFASIQPTPGGTAAVTPVGGGPLEITFAGGAPSSTIVAAGPLVAAPPVFEQLVPVAPVATPAPAPAPVQATTTPASGPLNEDGTPAAPSAVPSIDSTINSSPTFDFGSLPFELPQFTVSGGPGPATLALAAAPPPVAAPLLSPLLPAADARGQRAAGVTAGDMRGRGLTALDAANAGFTGKELAAAGYSLGDMIAAGVDLAVMSEAGHSIGAMLAAGLTPAQLRSAGASPAALAASGVPLTVLVESGFNLAEMSRSGIPVALLRDAGYSAQQMKDAGLSYAEMAGAGFTAGDLLATGASLNDLSRAGVTLQETKSTIFSGNIISSLGGVGNMGVSLGEATLTNLNTPTLSSLASGGSIIFSLPSTGGGTVNIPSPTVTPAPGQTAVIGVASPGSGNSIITFGDGIGG